MIKRFVNAWDLTADDRLSAQFISCRRLENEVWRKSLAKG